MGVVVENNPNSLKAILLKISEHIEQFSSLPEYPIYLFAAFIAFSLFWVVFFSVKFTRKIRSKPKYIEKSPSKSIAIDSKAEEIKTEALNKSNLSEQSSKAETKPVEIKTKESIAEKKVNDENEEKEKLEKEQLEKEKLEKEKLEKEKLEKERLEKERLEKEKLEKEKLEKEKLANSEVEQIKKDTRAGWLTRLKKGLTKTRTNLQTGLKDLLTGKQKIDEETLEDLHELLYRSDVGFETADLLVDHLRKELKARKIEEPDQETIKSILKDKISELVDAPSQTPVNIPTEGPMVILVVGVNGVGKTTSIGKLAARFLSEDKKVILAAADTFRAAAIDQLRVWGDRLGVRVVYNQPNSDPSSVVFDSVKAAKSAGADILLIDTAGRLHNKKELMQELEKMNKVVGREIPDAPHETWLVVDSTTGQNAHMQIKAFREVVKLSGLVVTKLDGTAKGGVVVGACYTHKLPVRYIGVGEKAADLREFSGKDFADMML